MLDQEMLEDVSRITIAARTTPNDALPRKSGAEVANELRGRVLLRYLVGERINSYQPGSPQLLYTSPTPFAPSDLSSWLALPSPEIARTFVTMLDPAQIHVILGPRWVRRGKGIEYLLPQGYPIEAIILGWPIPVT